LKTLCAEPSHNTVDQHLNALYLLSAPWAELCPNGRAEAIETARSAGRHWAHTHRDRYTADAIVGNVDYNIFLWQVYGEAAFGRWDTPSLGWTEDTDDLRVCHFCAELERQRRLMHGLPAMPECHNALRMNLILAEQCYHQAGTSMDEDGAAMEAALLARMLLAAAVGRAIESDVWEVRACHSDETEVLPEVEEELGELGRILNCKPEKALRRAIRALKTRS
jgi:hypothetical protein